MLFYSIPEWGKIPVVDGVEVNGNTIPTIFIKGLEAAVKASFPESESIDDVLLFKKDSISARKYVGVVGTKDCTLEILPKIDADGSENTNAIRERFVEMLSIALDTNINVGSLTNFSWEKNPILEFLIKAFTEKLFDLVRQGLPRSYISTEDDLLTLRGSLNITRQFTRHAVNPSRLACKFDELTANIPLNQKIKTTIHYLYNFSQDLTNQQKLRELMFLYADIADVPIARLITKKIYINRTNERWNWIITMADFLLKGLFQSQAGHADPGYSFLFNMSRLFEDYIGRRLCKVASSNGLTVELQNEMRFCISELNEEKLFSVRPDILIKREGKVVQIIDTKWKHLASLIASRNMGVSVSDVYQMNAYGMLHECSDLTLLYPHSTSLGESDGVQLPAKILEGNRSLAITTIDIGNSKNESARIKEILSRC